MSDKVLSPDLYINRELSWIAFNERVLVQALDERTPLLEQAKFSAIFSNNLDEFFMVRVASLKAQVEAGIEKLSEDGHTPIEQLHAIREHLTPLLHKQQEHYRSRLKIQLLEHGAHLLDYEQLNERQRLWVDNYFQTAIFPVLTPLAVDPAHPFPFVSNLSLNVAALIRDPQSGQSQLARVKVPQKILPRFVTIPTDLSGGDCQPIHTAVPLEQVVAFNLGLLFPGMSIEGHYFFRVTRDADLELRDLEADDLMIAIEQGLRKRRMGGEVVRLEVADEMPQDVVEMLMEGMSVEEEDLYRVDGPLGLDDLFGLMGIPLPQLKDEGHSGLTPAILGRAQRSMLEDGSLKEEEFESIFSVVRRRDVLLHHPYDLFSTSVEEFINQAADDPLVMGIKMTLYRTSKDSPIIAALIRAAENGKQVMALVELKARFDEDNNIQWAKQLESSGVHVVYGVLGLKTHTKIVLVVRKEKERLRSYVHIGTGNYNSKTSRLYTDLGCSPHVQSLVRIWWSCSTTSLVFQTAGIPETACGTSVTTQGHGKPHPTRNQTCPQWEWRPHQGQDEFSGGSSDHFASLRGIAGRRHHRTDHSWHVLSLPRTRRCQRQHQRGQHHWAVPRTFPHLLVCQWR